MALIGARRGRHSRTASLRVVPTSRLGELWNLVSQRANLARLCMVTLAIAATAVAIQAWRIPFPYRLNQKPAAGICAKIDFQRANRARTDRARQRAEENVPYMFRHDPAPLTRLPTELRAALVLFGRAKSLDDVTAEQRSDFGLTAAATNSQSPVPMRVNDRVASFSNLNRIASDDALLTDVIDAFTKFIQPLEERGLLRPEHLPPYMSAADAVAIVDKSGRQVEAGVSEILLLQLLAPGGGLHSSWSKFPVLLSIRPELEHWLAARAPETLSYDDEATQAARQLARQAVRDIPEVYNRGNLMVAPGESIDEAKLALLQAEHDEAERHLTVSERVIRVLTVVLLLIVLSVLNGHYLIRSTPRVVASYRSLGLYLTVLVVTVALSQLLSYDPWRAAIGPILSTVMIFAIAFSQVLAVLTAFTLCVINVLATGGDMSEFVLLMSVCAAAVLLLPNVPSRSTVVVVGFFAGGMYLLMYWATAMIGWGTAIVDENQTNYVIWSDPNSWMHCLRGAGWCVLAGFIISGSLPFIESTFGVVTDISLLELGDVSHPLLQELVRRAPGTYNHSMTVATLGEMAADRIGANGLLVRVGAYFHDIGKMLKPHYFVENIVAGGENRHRQLAPAMSTLIIIGHVKDGIDLAEQHNLPAPLIELIEQHHGTTLVEYFFHEASKHLDPDHRTDAEESHFRYPGPKPRSREAAVLMIVDACEGASRSLSEPTPKRLERLVHEIAMKRLLDGQFDESGLTLTELHLVEESLTKSLIAMYHGRVKYPEQRSA